MRPPGDLARVRSSITAATAYSGDIAEAVDVLSAPLRGRLVVILGWTGLLYVGWVEGFEDRWAFLFWPADLVSA